ncbi:MAG: SlyX family protein [Treponema sp.]|nr:SlyX family protein [Treponema sp.]MCQ2572799.1 SlyX family protein [Treponema sp.]
MEERITNIEIKLAYMEDFVNQIQEVAVKQAEEIEKLKHDNQILSQKLKDVYDNMEGDIPNRKPPHY